MHSLHQVLLQDLLACLEKFQGLTIKTIDFISIQLLYSLQHFCFCKWFLKPFVLFLGDYTTSCKIKSRSPWLILSVKIGIKLYHNTFDSSGYCISSSLKTNLSIVLLLLCVVSNLWKNRLFISPSFSHSAWDCYLYLCSSWLANTSSSTRICFPKH